MAVLKAEAVAKKVEELNGNLAAVARAFGVCRSAVHKFVHSRPALAAALHDCREGMKDHAESSLHRALLAGEAWAVCFFLKTQAKDRGYVERSESAVTVDARAAYAERAMAPILDGATDDELLALRDVARAVQRRREAESRIGHGGAA